MKPETAFGRFLRFWALVLMSAFLVDAAASSGDLGYGWRVDDQLLQLCTSMPIGLNASAIQSALTSYQNEVNQYIAAHAPNPPNGATVGQVLGMRTVVPSAADVLPSGLPYRIEAVGSPFAALSDAVRYQFQLSLYGSADTSQPAVLSYASSLPAINSQRLSLSFVPPAPSIRRSWPATCRRPAAAAIRPRCPATSSTSAPSSCSMARSSPAAATSNSAAR